MDIENNTYPRITVDLTHRCNLKCATCYDRYNKGHDISINEFTNLCERLPNPVVMILAGGEPTLHPDLAELIKIGNSKGHAMCLGTNGKIFTYYWYVSDFKKSIGNTPLIIGLSIDDPLITGENFEPWKLIALKNIINAGFDKIAIASIITPETVGQIKKLIDLALYFPENITYVGFRPLSKASGVFPDINSYTFTELNEIVENTIKKGYPDINKNLKITVREIGSADAGRYESGEIIPWK